MIRALIVDDEYLVRKGLALTIAWEKFGIQIIGEADGGESALRFMAENPLDLLLTDITMPNMSGFELIEQVTVKYPNICIVVVTCYEEFFYIQKALRSGAVDYIVKTELEDEKLCQDLERIANLVLHKEKGEKEQTESYDYGLYILKRYMHTNTCSFSDTQTLSFGTDEVLYCIQKQNLALYQAQFQEKNSAKDCILVGIDQLTPENARDKVLYLQKELESEWMYQLEPSVMFYELDLLQLRQSKRVSPMAGDVFSDLKKDWCSVNWLIDPREYERLQNCTKEKKAGSAQLKALDYMILSDLELSLNTLIPQEFYNRLENIKFWCDYAIWFDDLRRYLSGFFTGNAYPDETIHAILSSVEYIKQHFCEELYQEKLAHQFHLSRSYFSKVFKDIIGVNFSDYLRNIRMEKAKTLLLNTNLTIYRIAQEVGFQDEKYFSRLFKEITNLTPVEYRHQAS